MTLVRTSDLEAGRASGSTGPPAVFECRLRISQVKTLRANYFGYNTWWQCIGIAHCSLFTPQIQDVIITKIQVFKNGTKDVLDTHTLAILHVCYFVCRRQLLASTDSRSDVCAISHQSTSHLVCLHLPSTSNLAAVVSINQLPIINKILHLSLYFPLYQYIFYCSYSNNNEVHKYHCCIDAVE